MNDMTRKGSYGLSSAFRNAEAFSCREKAPRSGIYSAFKYLQSPSHTRSNSFFQICRVTYGTMSAMLRSGGEAGGHVTRAMLRRPVEI